MVKSSFAFCLLTGIQLFLNPFSAEAAITIGADGTDSAHLVSIDIDGSIYTNFIGVDLTAYNAGTSLSFQIQPDGTPAATGSAATALLEDLSLTSGYAGLRDYSFDFLNPVVNIPGPEIFIFDFSPAAIESDALNVTINSQTINENSGGSQVLEDSGLRIDADGFTNVLASSIFQLENLSDWALAYPNWNNAVISYFAVDLSDYGVAPGGTTSSIQMTSNQSWDVTAVVAVPEPASAAVLLLGLTGLLALRRSRT